MLLKHRWAVVPWVVVGFLAAASASQADDWTRYLRVSFIDVGQGDAILIQGPAGSDKSPGRTILIDGGPDQGAGNRVPMYLGSYGLPAGSVLDYVILTHPHDDHYKGLLDVLDRYEVRMILDSGHPQGGKYHDFVQKAQAETVDSVPSAYVRLRDQPDLTLDWGTGVDAEVLWAERAGATGLGSGGTRVNNASVVIRMTYGKFSFLFTGDAEGKARNQSADTLRYVEKVLLDEQPLDRLRATVLKVAHHGSETSSTLPFIRAVRPELLVVQSGRRKFGSVYLPDATVLARYAAEFSNVTILRTDFQDEDEGRTTANDQDGDDVFLFTDGAVLRAYQARVQGDARQWVRVKVIE